MRRTIENRRAGPAAGALAALSVAVLACTQDVPTWIGEDALPETPLTFEVTLGWSEFGSNLRVLGGYSSASFVPSPVVAHTYEGSLESRALMRFGAFATTVRVVNEDGVAVPDDSITYIGGHLMLGFDTLTSRHDGPVRLEVGSLQEEWDAGSASWEFAVDSLGDQRAWTTPGGGASTLIGTGVWDPLVADSVNFVFDSAAVAAWTDPLDQARGARIEAVTDDARLQLVRARFRVSIRSSINPDTVVEDTVTLADGTFVYDPAPAAPSGVRVGGIPAWRSVLDVAVPALTGPPELCEALGCPYTPEPGQVIYAGLVLTSEPTEPGFQPSDSLRIDARPVLSPSTLPKSPLGLSQTAGLGTAVPPEAFGSAPGSSATVEVPVTSFLRTLLRGPDANGRPPPYALALLAAPEPSSLAYASFAAEPSLRIVLTVAAPLTLP